MMFRKCLLSGAGSVVALVMGGVSPAAHAAVAYTTSFESPAFTAGNLLGQNDWSVASINSGTMNVVNSAAGAYAGSQFVSYNTADANGDGSYIKTIQAPYTLSASQVAASPDFEASVYVKIAPNGPADNLSWGGLDLISGTGRVGSLYFGSNGIAAATTNAGTVAGTPVAGIIAGEYNKLSIKIDFDTDAVEFYINDVLFRQATSANASNLTIATIFASRTGASAGHVFSFDNLTLNAVPEPATAGVLVLAGLALTARRRTR